MVSTSATNTDTEKTWERRKDRKQKCVDNNQPRHLPSSIHPTLWSVAKERPPLARPSVNHRGPLRCMSVHTHRGTKYTATPQMTTPTPSQHSPDLSMCSVFDYIVNGRGMRRDYGCLRYGAAEATSNEPTTTGCCSSDTCNRQAKGDVRGIQYVRQNSDGRP